MSERSDELRAHMKAMGLSERKLAGTLNVSVRTVRYWKSDTPSPPLMALYALRYLWERQNAGGGD